MDLRILFKPPYLDAHSVTDPMRKSWRNIRIVMVDSFISFTDVWANNYLKETEGKLRFIDPIIKFERLPKEIFVGKKLNI